MTGRYNPRTGICDLSKDEIPKLEAYDAAATEAAERRRQERLQRSRNMPLDQEAKDILGTLTPDGAWFYVQDKVSEAVVLSSAESEALAHTMGLYDPGSDFQCLDDVVVLLAKMNPVQGINHLVYINPTLRLNHEDLGKAKPLEILQAVLLIFTKSDRWAAG